MAKKTVENCDAREVSHSFRRFLFLPECWDTTWPSQKPSPHMVQQKEGKGSGDHISNAEETRRAWKIVQARRIQAVREEKLLELHVSQEVGSKLKRCF